MLYTDRGQNLSYRWLTPYIFSGSNGCRHHLVVGGRTWPTLACFFVDCGRDKRIVLVTQLRYMQINGMSIYNESVHRKEQLGTRINTIQYKMLTVSHP